MSKQHYPEILAPCGSYEILIAAVRAGADACYIGGNKFGARAYASNLNEDNISPAINYAHLHNVKVYLTINTLFKEQEIYELYDYLLPYYEAGIDAVIVQDLGVFKFVRETFPDLPIHCSTQMNITSYHAAKLMKELGAARVVPAREMSLTEIKKIKENVDIEVECFVHGAMCYSYSGQCLMSSLAGGRSGNRGRCAQPCRKCYNDEYLLSMKDMCTIENIPDLISSGIDSFKIEGRMKNEYYVYSAVKAYRQMVDEYYKDNFSYTAAKELKKEMAGIYNRGGFCDGYFNTHNGKSMIAIKRPNNQGVPVGKINSVSNGSINIDTTENIYKGDVLEISLKDNTNIEITSGKECKKNEKISLKAPKTKYIIPGQTIYRTRCNNALNKIKKQIDRPRKINLSARLSAHIDNPLSLSLSDGENEVEIKSSFTVSKAKNINISSSDISKKLLQLGETEYNFSSVEIDMDEDIFIPLSEIKKIRREALLLYESKKNQVLRKNKPSYPKYNYSNPANKNQHKKAVNIGVSTLKQLNTVLSHGIYIDGIYINHEIAGQIDEQIYNKIKNRKIKIYLETPYVVHSSSDIHKYLPKYSIDGIYIRNLDGFACVRDCDMPLIIGSSLYAYNNLSRDFFCSLAKNICFELPKELTFSELDGLKGQNEFIIYEYTQVMLTANCIKKTKDKCNKCPDITKLRDDRGNLFYVRSICGECVNTILNGIPFYADNDIRNRLDECLNVSSYRINFTIEEDETVKNILDNIFTGINQSSTTGHLLRGVE